MQNVFLSCRKPRAHVWLLEFSFEMEIMLFEHLLVVRDVVKFKYSPALTYGANLPLRYNVESSTGLVNVAN